MVAQDQIEVRLKSRVREVGGPGEDSALGTPEDEHLGMQEVPLVAPHLDATRAQEVEEVAGRAAFFEIEGQEVAVVSEAALQLLKTRVTRRRVNSGSVGS